MTKSVKQTTRSTDLINLSKAVSIMITIRELTSELINFEIYISIKRIFAFSQMKCFKVQFNYVLKFFSNNIFNHIYAAKIYYKYTENCLLS